MVASSLPDYYGILEVDRHADELAIKKSYRRKVLLWHPDKHPVERDVAEQRIRQINCAYETLSNPLKRHQYDQQIDALERRATGILINTSAIKPKMSIPKEFMLCPMGHPDRFVRCAGRSLFVHSREDSELGFQDFFKEAKFSLWWLPQVNNMCHLRSQSSAAQGERGGLNVAFSVVDNLPSVEAKISHIQDPSSFFKVVASPVFQGAFRFECQYFLGYHLVFRPPTHLHIVNALDGSSMPDFMLVDYSSSFKYMTLEEVLIPIIEGLGGHHKYVSVNAVLEDKNTRLYFQNVLKKQMWSQEDFEAYFDGHYQHWAYDARQQQVRVRSKQEKLADALQRARSGIEVATVVSSSGDELGLLAVDTAEAVLRILDEPLPQGCDVSICVNHMTAQKKILAALPSIYRCAPLQRLIAIFPKVARFGGERPTRDELMMLREDSVKVLSEVASRQISEGGMGSMTASTLEAVCRMPLDWGVCGEALLASGRQTLAAASLEELLSLLRTCAKLPRPGMLESFAAAAKLHLPNAEPRVAAEALELLISSDLAPASAAADLWHLHCRGVPVEHLAPGVAALGEKCCEDRDLGRCAAAISSAPHACLEAFNTGLILRLTVACTKSAVVAEALLDAITGAAAATLHAWSMDDIPKLLFAAARARSTCSSTAVARIFAVAEDMISPKLPELSAAALIKILLAVSKASASRSLFEMAAKEALKRVADLPGQQSLLLTQALLPLGDEHPVLDKLLHFWESGPHALTADQLVKLLQMLAPVVKSHSVYEAISLKIADKRNTLTAAGCTSLAAALSDKSGVPNFRGKSTLLRIVRKAGRESLEKSKGSSSRSCSRQRHHKRRSRSRSHKKRNRSYSADVRRRSRSRQDHRSHGRRR